MVSLTPDKGIKLTIAEERDKRLAAKAKAGHWKSFVVVNDDGVKSVALKLFVELFL